MPKSSYVLSMVSYALSLWISLFKSFCCKEVPTTAYTVFARFGSTPTQHVQPKPNSDFALRQ